MYKNIYYRNNQTDTENSVKKKKKNKTTSLNRNFNQNHEDSVDVDYIVEIQKSLNYCICHQSFLLNNQLHKHLQTNYSHNKIADKAVTLKLMLLYLKLIISKSSIYIRFTVTNVFSLNDYKFWNWHYVMINAKLLFSATTDQFICLNTDCIMILIDRQFLKKQNFDIMICQMSSFIPVWELSTTIHNFDQYAKINIYFINMNRCTAVISWKIHIINDL